MIVIAGLILAFVLLLIFSRPATRQCRWREYPKEAQSEWRCVFCGAATLGETGRRPKACYRS